MATPSRVAGVGAFVLAGVALIGIGLFMIGDRRMAFADTFTIYTSFHQITGVQTGAIVRVSGARAGSVQEIAVPTGPAGTFRVTLQIDEKLHPLVRTDSIAKIRTEGLVGGSYLAISTGSESAPRAADGSTIPSQEPFDVSDLLQQMSDTIRVVNGTIASVQDELERAIKSVTDTVHDADDLIASLRGDITSMATTGARIMADAAQIADGIRQGQGTIGKLVTDDALYTKAVGIATNAEQVAVETRQAVAAASQAIASLRQQSGPVSDVATNLRATLGGARRAMAELADDMAALKHNFLLRGFFKSRGYFSLAGISPADYLKGRLTENGDRRKIRVWLREEVLFEPVPGHPDQERLSDAGRARLDAAIAPFLTYLADTPLVVEGYSQAGARAERYLRSRSRAGLVRDYLLERFALDPQNVGDMPLGEQSVGTPGDRPWDGVALAVFLDRHMTRPPS